MRHQKSGRKLNRTSSHRRALFRNLVAALIHHERIRTTDAKAKELRGIADRMVTLGKQASLHARRRAFDKIRDRDAVKKLFEEIAPRFSERAGGYTRIVKLGVRSGDAAPVSLIEWTAPAGESEKGRSGRKRPARRAVGKTAESAGKAPAKASSTRKKAG